MVWMRLVKLQTSYIVLHSQMNQCSFLLDYFGDPLEDITLRRKLKNMIQFSQDIPQESVTERYLSILDNVGFYGDGRKY